MNDSLRTLLSIQPTMDLLALRLLVQWPHRSIWKGTCRDSRTFDFEVKTASGTVWRWSDGQTFAQEVTDVRIEGGEWIVFADARWEITERNADLQVTATFVATGAQAECRLHV